MTTRILWPALLLVAAAACADGSAGPVDFPVDRPFDFAMPTVRQLHNVTAEDVPPSDTLGAANSYTLDELPEDFRDAVMRGWLIKGQVQADAGFLSDHSMAFGQGIAQSTGSSYRTEVNLTVSYLGTTVGTNSGVEEQSCLNCQHFHAPWGRIANTTLPVQGFCGHGARATAKHTARLDFTFFSKGTWNLLAESGTADAQGSQPPCSFQGGGYGGGNGDDDWYLCFWEDIYDWNGEYLGRRDLGCMPINVA